MAEYPYVKTSPMIQVINELQRRKKIAPEMANEFRLRINKKENPGFADPGGTLEKQAGHLPMYGGIAGGIVGGVPGAAFGGALGSAGKEAVDLLTGKTQVKQPESVMESLKQNIEMQKGMMGRMVPDAMKQSMYQMGGDILGRGMQIGSQAISKYTPLLKAKARGAVESIPVVGGWVKGGRQLAEQEAKSTFKAAEATRKSAFQAEEQARKIAHQTARDSVKAEIKALPQKGRVDAAAGLQDTIKSVNKKSFKEYDAVAKPILNKYGKETIRGQEMRDALIKPLKKAGYIDAKGNVLIDDINKIKTPELKKYYNDLNDWIVDLSSNPTFRQADRIRRDVQNAAFDQQRKVYAGVAHDFREGMMVNLESVAGKEGTQLAASRAKFSEVKPYLDEFSKIVKQHPEQIASRTGTQMPGTFIVDTIKKIPEARQPIADLVVNDLVKSSNTPQAFTKSIDKYGRDVLQKLVDKKTYKSIIKYETDLLNSSKPFLPGKFIADKMPPEKLGKFWQGIKNAAEKGERIDPTKVRILFQAMSNSLSQKTNSGGK